LARDEGLGEGASGYVPRRLTHPRIPIKLEESNRGCPDPREGAAIPFCSSRWEVVQLVGLQTLDLAILVRVQASQPTLVNQ
jgi:hypothetical protein